MVVANINRNILLNDISIYAKTLRTGGMLFLSGFYGQDKDMITEECMENHLQFVEYFERNNWIAACYKLK